MSKETEEILLRAIAQGVAEALEPEAWANMRSKDYRNLWKGIGAMAALQARLRWDREKPKGTWMGEELS